MSTILIPPSKALGFSDVYLDFLADKSPATDFYLAENRASVARKLDQTSFQRQNLRDILRKQNRLFGVSEMTFARIDKIVEPRAVCVFAGQQAGLLGGPMLTLIKALAIVRSARLYEQELGRPVIPIFWIAGEDQDFAEVNHLTLLNRGGEPCSIAYATPRETELPLFETYFSDAKELQAVKEKVAECLGESDFTPELFEAIDEAYTTEDTFVTSFGKFMARLTCKTGLVFFSPGDIDVKRLAVPFFHRLVEQQEELHTRVERANELLEQSGYHVQVEKKPHATYLFYNCNGRRPIMRDGDSFVCGETGWSRAELLDRITSEPHKFSPDVMTRPILQSFLFPTITQMGGPAEIAYLAQINPLFDVFELQVPVHQARPSVTIVEKRWERFMREHSIKFEELAGDIEQVVNRVLAETFPHDIEEGFKELRKTVEEGFTDFSEKMLDFDSSLRDFARQSFGKVDFTLKSFEGKVFASHKKKSKETRQRIYRLWQALYPNRGMQERSINVCYFISRYGFDFVSFCLDKLDSEEKSHQLILLSEWRR